MVGQTADKLVYLMVDHLAFQLAVQKVGPRVYQRGQLLAVQMANQMVARMVVLLVLPLVPGTS